MALTKVSGPLLNSGNHNLGNYVINNITGAAATFTSLDCSNIDLSADDLKIVGIITNSVLTPGTVVWVGTGNTLTESDNLTWDNTNVRLKNLGITSTKSLKVTGISTFDGAVSVGGTFKIPGATGANSNENLRVLYQTSDLDIDSDTGLLYNPAEDTLKVNGNLISAHSMYGSGGTLKLAAANHSSTSYVQVKDKVELHGNVGIGSTIPMFALEVVSNEASGYIASFRQHHPSNSAQLILHSPADNNIRPTSIDFAQGGTVKWSIGQAYASASSQAFHIATSPLQSGMHGSKVVVTTAGNVGIGSSVPTNALDVQGGTTNTAIVARSTDTKAQVSLVDNATTGVGCVAIGAEGDNLFLTSGSGGAEALRIHSTGIVEANSSFSNTYATTTNITPHIRVRNQEGADNIYGGIQFRADRSNGAAAMFNIACLNSSSNYASTLVLQSRNTDGNFSEKLRINSSGRVIIGHDSAIELGGYSSNLEVVASNVDAGINILRYSTDTGGPSLVFGKSKSATIGTASTVAENDNLGKIQFYGTDNNWEPAAAIQAFADGEWYSGGAGVEDNTDSPGRLEFHTTPNGSDDLAERLRINSDGSLRHTRSTNNQLYDVEFRQTGGIGDGNYSGIKWTQSSDGTTFLGSICMSYSDTGRPDMIFYQRDRTGSAGSDEGFRLTRDGNLTTCETHTFARANAGFTARKGDSVSITRNTGTPVEVNRTGNDGYLVLYYQAGSNEGGVSVSGSSVSYNGGVLTRWSQLVGISTNNKADRPSIYNGTIMSNLDEMCEWTGEENMQLNKTQVSTASGDKNVAGVFWGWDDDDDTYTNDFFVAQTGDYIIRVGAATTVTRGDLLESAGDGTAKPQSDDIVRSKTIAKVTSGIAHTTYADGSKTYPCVLMAS